jgi:hypothetical protein
MAIRDDDENGDDDDDSGGGDRYNTSRTDKDVTRVEKLVL